MKLLYLTDTHLRGNAPANRKDNFSLTLKAKLREVVELAHDYNVDAVLHGGDFFDNPVPALSVAAEFVEIFNGLKVPIYGIYGNHDIFAGNASTLPRTVLGFLSRLRVFDLLEQEQTVYIEAGGIKAAIKVTPYHLDMDRREPDADYVVSKDPESDLTIHMVHGMLLDRKDNFPGSCTRLDDIAHTGADLVLAGHNHLGFGAVTLGNKTFVNPGALVRLSNHIREIERQVAVALIDLTGGKVSCKLLPLQSAGPGVEVLDRTRAEEMAMRQLMLEKFTREVKAAADLQRWDVSSIIDELARSMDLEENIRLEALRRLSLAQEALHGKEERA